MSWVAVENALVAWIRAASGLPESAVLLANQKATQPALPFIELKLSPPRRSFSSRPSVVQSYDGSAPAGQEIALTAVFEIEITVQLQAFTDPTSGDSDARSLLQQVHDSLGLESTLQPLRDVGLGLSDAGDIVDLTALANTKFQGRAALDIVFITSSEAVEKNTYVATIGLTSTVTS